MLTHCHIHWKKMERKTLQHIVERRHIYARNWQGAPIVIAKQVILVTGINICLLGAESLRTHLKAGILLQGFGVFNEFQNTIGK